MKINKQKLYELYMNEVEELCEVCDWVTHVGPEDIVHMICHIIERHSKELIDHDSTGKSDQEL